MKMNQKYLRRLILSEIKKLNEVKDEQSVRDYLKEAHKNVTTGDYDSVIDKLGVLMEEIAYGQDIKDPARVERVIQDLLNSIRR